MGLRQSIEHKITDLSSFADYLKTCKNIIVMSGAGISTSAGIPDFRSPSFGLYDKLASFKLPYPEAVFTLDYFKKNPQAFYTLAHELYPVVVNAKPTTSHWFIKLLNDKGILLRHYTQNIDGLDELTGLPEDKVIQAHGHIKSGYCLVCGLQYSFDYLKEAVIQNKIPKCSQDDGVIKPNVVLFGEGLPVKFWKHLIDFRKCDCLIICGTSLVVQPFAGLAAKVASNVPRLLINRDHVGNPNMLGSFVTKVFNLDPQFNTSNENGRDVFYQGDCDQGFSELASLLNWKEDLDNLIN
jgi:NAD+-dependent protein deacetylase sirtuin 2